MVRWTVAVVVGLGGALAPVGLSLGAQDPAASRDQPRDRLILFLTPTDPDLEAVPRELARVRDAFVKARMRVDLRFVLLVSDFTKLAKQTTATVFIALVKELAEIAGERFEMRLVDEDGLALAAKLGIARTPAWALVEPHWGERTAKGTRAHVAYGAKPKFTEVLKCRSR